MQLSSKIFEVSGSEDTFVVPLELTTSNDSSLVIEDSNQKPIDHHFKVIAENSSGMFRPVKRF